MIYILVAVLIFVLNYVLKPDLQFDTKNKRNRMLYVSIISCIYFLLLLLRHDYVGTDTQNYRMIYDNFHIFVNSSVFSDISLTSEVGFFYLVHFLNQLQCPFEVLKLLSALFYMIVVSYVIYKYSQKVWFSYILFLLLGYFIFNTTMRQCFALSFFILAVDFAIRRKFLLYSLMIIFAILFHATAIILIPVWWIVQLRITYKSIAFYSLVAIAMYFFSNTIFSIGSEITGKEYVSSGAGGGLLLIFYLLIVGISFLYYKKMDENNQVYIFFMLLSISLMPLAMKNPAIFRINKYFVFYIIILIPNLCLVMERSIRTLFIISIMTIGVFQFTYSTSQAGIRVLPYVFFWEDYRKINPNAPYDLY